MIALQDCSPRSDEQPERRLCNAPERRYDFIISSIRAIRVSLFLFNDESVSA
jgi:hypothetical protein